MLKLPHGGENATRNAAITAADGAYIAFLDHDDIWQPGKIVRQIEALEANPQAGLCHTGYQRLHADGLGKEIVHRDGAYEGCCFEAEFRRNGVGALTAMVRRSALPPHVFHEDIQIAADYALWLDILFEHEAVYLPQVYGLHRQHDKQITHGRRERWKVYEAVARMRLLGRVSGRMPEAEHAALREWALEALREAADERRSQGDYGWAHLGFQLLSRWGAPAPWADRISTAILGRLQLLTPAGRAERRYLRPPA